MKPRINILTLASDDLERSMKFYHNGLGWPTSGIAEGFEDHVLFELNEHLSFVLCRRSDLALAAGESVGTRSSTEVVLTWFAGSRHEVDEVLQAAQTAGATIPSPPEDAPWGYTGYFKDPDGHLWEIMWNKAFEQK